VRTAEAARILALVRTAEAARILVLVEACTAPGQAEVETAHSAAEALDAAGSTGVLVGTGAGAGRSEWGAELEQDDAAAVAGRGIGYGEQQRALGARVVEDEKLSRAAPVP
jgi:hypothetical protein